MRHLQIQLPSCSPWQSYSTCIVFSFFETFVFESLSNRAALGDILVPPTLTAEGITEFKHELAVGVMRLHCAADGFDGNIIDWTHPTA